MKLSKFILCVFILDIGNYVPLTKAESITLLLAMYGKIMTSSENGTEILTDNVTKPLQIDYHSTTSQIFWTDDTNECIYSYQRGGSVELIVPAKTNHKPHGIGVDSNSDILYWSDIKSNTIYRSNLDGSNITNVCNSDGPVGAITLNVDGGLIYFISYKSNGRVEVCTTDGQTNYVVFNNRYQFAIDIALDASRLYVLGRGEVTPVSLSNYGTGYLFTEHISYHYNYGIDVFENKVYYTDMTWVFWAYNNGIIYSRSLRQCSAAVYDLKIFKTIARPSTSLNNTDFSTTVSQDLIQTSSDTRMHPTTTVANTEADNSRFSSSYVTFISEQITQTSTSVEESDLPMTKHHNFPHTTSDSTIYPTTTVGNTEPKNFKYSNAEVTTSEMEIITGSTITTLTDTETYSNDWNPENSSDTNYLMIIILTSGCSFIAGLAIACCFFFMLKSRAKRLRTIDTRFFNDPR